MQTDLLPNEVEAWEHNRTVYPGWLIAPVQVRTRLWRQLQTTIPRFLRHRAAFDLPLQLRLLFELNWKLETALLPIWNDFLPAYTDVLTRINPFPNDVTDLPQAELTLTASNAEQHDWTSIRNHWTVLMLGVVRYYREERQSTLFEVFHARLARIRHLTQEVIARCCYERCLFAIGELDDEAAHSSLLQWPDDTVDYFWAVRKAAILAELGKTDQALQLAESALLKIRLRPSLSTDNIPGLSREGWTISLIRTLQANQRLRSGLPPFLDTTPVRSRFKQLRNLSCSPDDIADYFDVQLDQPAPTEPQLSETISSFQPGRASRTAHFGSDFIEKLLPAYQFYRLVEEAAQPPSLGTVNLTATNLKRVAAWFSEHDPVRTQSLLIRLQDHKDLNTYFVRHRIAALPADSVQTLAAHTLRAINLLRQTTTPSVRPQSDEQRRATARLNLCIELLSRTCIRKSEEQLSEVWDAAISLYKDRSIRTGIGFDDVVRELFSSLIVSTSDSQLPERLLALAQLPIKNEPEFQVSLPESWPDPFLLAMRRFSTTVWQHPPNELRTAKARFLQLLASDDLNVKRTALYRLHALQELGALTATERRQLARIFWESAPTASAIPVDSWGSVAAHIALSLPTPRGLSAADRVKEYILSSQLGSVHGGALWPENLFDLILSATEQPDQPLTTQRYVSWSSEDALRIFAVIEQWWNTHGRTTALRIHQVSWSRALDSDAFLTFIARLFEVLSSVIIPRAYGDRVASRRIIAVVEDMRANYLPTGRILPAILILRPRSVNDVIVHLRQDFANTEREYYLSALRGTVWWLDATLRPPLGNSSRRRFPSLPSDLLSEISTAVAIRHPDSIGLALDAAYNIVHRLQSQAEGHFVRNLVVGLTYLVEETGYREKAIPAFRYPYEDIPTVRWLAARLARSLSDHGHGNDSTIRRWLTEIAADPLPEIRHLAVTSASDL